jgi:hypothetical protein
VKEDVLQGRGESNVVCLDRTREVHGFIDSVV